MRLPSCFVLHCNPNILSNDHTLNPAPWLEGDTSRAKRHHSYIAYLVHLNSVCTYSEQPASLQHLHLLQLLNPHPSLCFLCMHRHNILSRFVIDLTGTRVEIKLVVQDSGADTNSGIMYAIARSAAETGHRREGKRLIAALDPNMSKCAGFPIQLPFGFNR